jgi:hypothetical protein
MANLPTDPDSKDAPAPRWVKLLGLAAIAFIAVFVVLHLLGGGLGHHMPADSAAPVHGSAHHDH